MSLRTALVGAAQPASMFMVPITSVSWIDRSSWGESIITARCTTVSMRSWRMSLPITAWRASAWTKSISSRALTGSATSQPKRCGTCPARRRATSAPSGFDTPVTRTRFGVIRPTNLDSLYGSPDSFRASPGASAGTPDSLYVKRGVPRGDPDPPALLWIDASDRRGVGDALHGQRIGGEPHVDPLVDRRVEDLVEGARDHVVQLGVDLLLLPEEGLQVLHPLEVGDDHTARVGDDVGDQEDAALVEDGVRLGRDRRVGALCDEPRPDASRVLVGDLVLHRGGHQHRDRKLEQLRVGDGVGLLEPTHAAAHLAVLLERGEVQAPWVVDAALRVADRDHLQPGLGEEPRRRAADLPIALHGDGRRFVVDVEVLERLQRQVGRPATRRVHAPLRAAHVHGLASDRRRH